MKKFNYLKYLVLLSDFSIPVMKFSTSIIIDLASMINFIMDFIDSQIYKIIIYILFMVYF